MTKETTFFSYSRSDSKFVLGLAKDLREAGADLWLDQLDIKAGSHWDSSIEEALQNSSRLIVVLSPASVGSNNVMDEVNYALESGKILIPVLLSECTIPFRLRRVQHINFTGDYETGLKQLLEVLHSPAGDQSQSSHQAMEEKNGSDRRHELQFSEKENIAPGKAGRKNRSKVFFWVGAGIILLAIATWIIINSGKTTSEEFTAAKSDTSDQGVTLADTQNIRSPASSAENNTQPSSNENTVKQNISPEEENASVTRPDTKKPALPTTVINKENINEAVEQTGRVKRNDQAQNVREVNYCNYDDTKCGSFTMIGEKQWVEKNSDGTFSYKEASRDEHSIYLAGNYNITLDLHKKQILANDNLLYKITGFK